MSRFPSFTSDTLDTFLFYLSFLIPFDTNLLFLPPCIIFPSCPPFIPPFLSVLLSSISQFWFFTPIFPLFLYALWSPLRFFLFTIPPPCSSFILYFTHHFFFPSLPHEHFPYQSPFPSLLRSFRLLPVLSLFPAPATCLSPPSSPSPPPPSQC